MNRYPLWKNLFVFGVVFLAAVLALPNIFGEDEAVHVSRTDGMPVDEAALGEIRTQLADGGVDFLSVAIEDDAALVRFDTVEQQLRANDALREALPNHVVALTLSSRTPSWLRAIGLKPMSLGLDLRGGVHFLYQVDLNTAVEQFLATYETDLRAQLREANIRNDVRVEGSSLLVSVLEPADVERADEIIRRLDAGDQFMQLGQITSRLIIDSSDV
jgi:preprotein translocase subunit SecD